MMFDGKAFGLEIVAAVKEHVAGVVAPLATRLDAIEKRFDEMPPPVHGKDADMVVILATIRSEVTEATKHVPLEIERMVDERVGAAVAKLPVPKDGDDADPEVMRQMVDEAVAKLPLPEHGKDADNEAIALALVPEVKRAVAENFEVTKAEIEEKVETFIGNWFAPELASLRDDLDAIKPDIEAMGVGIGQEIDEKVAEGIAGLPKALSEDDVDAMILAAIEALPEPEHGKDADPAETAALVKAEVEKAVAALPEPRDGDSITLDDVAPLIDEAVSRAVSGLPRPKDGVGLAGAVIDRAGNLTLTLTDGSTRELGVIVGKDVDRNEVVAMVRDEVAKIPPPKPGQDGVGFDDLDVTLGDDERTITITAVRGENRKSWELRLPHVIDRGVYRAGTDYAKGDGVTWGGSFWIAQRDTSDKPETTDAWRLSVKRGRDFREPVKESKPPEPVKVDPPKKDG